MRPLDETFPNGAAALEYACKKLDCTLRERAFLPAIVLDAREELGSTQAVEVRPDGHQIAALRVASADGGFVVLAATLGPKGPRLKPGDFVAWQATRQDDARAKALGALDPRSGWVGSIIGTLHPKLGEGRWLGAQKFSN